MICAPVAAEKNTSTATADNIILAMQIQNLIF